MTHLSLYINYEKDIFSCFSNNWFTSLYYTLSRNGASGGVEATIIDDNVFQVRASVNGYTHKSIANQYALRKAAEVSKSLGVVISQLLTIQARVTIKIFLKLMLALRLPQMVSIMSQVLVHNIS